MVPVGIIQCCFGEQIGQIGYPKWSDSLQMSSLSLLCLFVVIGGLANGLGVKPRKHLAAIDIPSCARWMWWGKEETCAKVVERFGFKDATDLVKLNVNLKCDVAPGVYADELVCVQRLKEGVISKATYFCEEFIVASAGDTCDLISKTFEGGWDIAALNPELNCEKLIEGELLCGKMFTTPVCKEFHRVLKSDETCQSVVEKEKLRGLATLITLNPALDCRKPMRVGQMLCTKIGGFDD